MKKGLLFFLILSVVATALLAEAGPAIRLWGGLVAPDGGLALSRYQGLPVPVGIPEIRYKNTWRTGIGLGAGLELMVPRAPLSFILGLGYLQKGTELEIYNLDTKTGSYFYRLGTLSQTGLVKIGPNMKIAPYLLAGYELALILSHRGQPFGSSPIGPTTDLDQDTRNVDLSLVAGVGLEFRLNAVRPIVEVCYFHGLKNLSQGTGTLEYYPTIKSRVLFLNLGLKFILKKTRENSG